MTKLVVIYLTEMMQPIHSDVFIFRKNINCATGHTLRWVKNQTGRDERYYIEAKLHRHIHHYSHL